MRLLFDVYFSCLLISTVGAFTLQPSYKLVKSSGLLSNYKSFISSSATDETYQDPNPVGLSNFLDKMVSRSYVTKLTRQTSDIRGTLQTLFHANLILGFAFVKRITMSKGLPLTSLIGTLGLAFVSSFLFMPLHETVHETAFRKKWMNQVLAQIVGFLCLRPAVHYFYYHWAHHRFTGNAEKDSELQPSALDMDINSVPGYILYISGIPFWFDAISTTCKHALGIFKESYFEYSSPNIRAKVTNVVKKEARIYILLYSLLGTIGFFNKGFGQSLMTYWVIPSILGQPFLRFYLLAEHRGCVFEPNGQGATNIMYNTRSMKTNWLIRKLAWQMPFHLEHHAWPTVPFHKLPELNKILNYQLSTVISDSEKDPKNPELQEMVLRLDKVGCEPKGDQGYVNLNMVFFRNLMKSNREENVLQ